MKNKKSERVEEIKGIILGLELKLGLLEDDLITVIANLKQLNTMKEDLIYNINLHRGDTVITVMKEYKRSIDELKLVRGELSNHEKLRVTLKTQINSKSKRHDYYMDEYDKAYSDLENESVILLFNKAKNSE
jgi:hypothetical protein